MNRSQQPADPAGRPGEWRAPPDGSATALGEVTRALQRPSPPECAWTVQADGQRLLGGWLSGVTGPGTSRR